MRVPVLYGVTEANRFDESAVNILIEKIRKQESYAVDSVQIRYPTHCIDVARFCTRLIQKYYQSKESSNSNPIRGIFHCSSLKPYTKYSMSCVMADVMSLPKQHIKQDLSAKDQAQTGSRPNNPQLQTAYSYELLEFEPCMDFEKCIKECLEIFID